MTGMYRVKRMIGLLVAGLALAFSATAFADRASELARRAGRLVPETCGTGIGTAQDCHTRYPAGCSRSRNPSYDAYMNYLKNQVPAPESAPSRQLTQQDIEDLDGQIPDTLSTRNHGQHAEDLARLGEGEIIGINGFLYFAEKTGKESTNCQLTAIGNVDFHLGLGFDAATAARLQDRGPARGTALRRLKQESMVLEMTPHYRAWHRPEWTLSLVRRYTGRQVKAVGQLMLDNEHWNGKETCSYPRAKKRTCWRATAWEMHPVTKLSVCTTGSTCAWGSPGWVEIGNEP